MHLRKTGDHKVNQTVRYATQYGCDVPNKVKGRIRSVNNIALCVEEAILPELKKTQVF